MVHPTLEVTLAIVCAVIIRPVLCSVHTDTSDDSGCSRAILQDCIGNLKVTPLPLGRQIIPDITSVQLNSLCRDWSFASDCMTSLKDVCTQSNTTNPRIVTEVNQAIDEVNNGLGFMCDAENKNVYTSEALSCRDTNATELSAAEKLCVDAYNNATWHLDKTNFGNIYSFCTSAKEYLACIKESVESICNEQTADWTYNYHVNFWRAHLDNVECSLETGMEIGALFIITICASAAVYTVVCVIIAFVVEAQKKKKGKKLGEKESSQPLTSNKED